MQSGVLMVGMGGGRGQTCVDVAGWKSTTRREFPDANRITGYDRQVELVCRPVSSSALVLLDTHNRRDFRGRPVWAHVEDSRRRIIGQGQVTAFEWGCFVIQLAGDVTIEQIPPGPALNWPTAQTAEEDAASRFTGEYIYGDLLRTPLADTLDAIDAGLRSNTPRTEECQRIIAYARRTGKMAELEAWMAGHGGKPTQGHASVKEERPTGIPLEDLHGGPFVKDKDDGEGKPRS